MQKWADNLRQRSDGQESNTTLEVGRYVGAVVLDQGRRCISHS